MLLAIHPVLFLYFGGMFRYWQGPLQNVSLPTYIRDAGYTTGLFGKELNVNTDDYVSPGWDRFFALGGSDEVCQNCGLSMNVQRTKGNHLVS